MKKTHFNYKISKYLKRLSLLLVLLSLVACGAGESEDSENPNSVIQKISTEKTVINVLSDTDSSHQVEIAISYSDSSSEILTLKVDWDKETQSFVVEDAENGQFTVDVVSDGENNDSKKLRITEIESNETTEVEIAVDPVVLEKIEFAVSEISLDIDENFTPSFLLTYTNGETTDELPDTIVCFASEDSPVIEITDSCNVTAKQAGTAILSVELPDALILESLQFPILTITVNDPELSVATTITQLNVTSDTTEILVGDSVNLQVLADYSDGLSDQDATALVNCVKVAGDAEVTIQDCQVQAQSAGSVEISAELKDSQASAPEVQTVTLNINNPPPQGSFVNDLYFEEDSIALVSGEVTSLNIIAEWSNGDVQTLNAQANCTIDQSIYLDLIFVSEDCQVMAWFPGEYTVEAQLIDNNLAAQDMTTKAITISVSPVNIGTLDANSTIAIDGDYNSSAVALEINGVVANSIYKVTLSPTNTATIVDPLIFNVLSNGTYGVGCQNYTIPGEVAVACGVKLQNNTLTVFLENIDQASPLGKLDYTLAIETDDNILDIDGDPLDLDPNKSNHQIVTLGTSFTGHVAANNYGINNQSLYLTDVENGMNQNGGDYIVEIFFNSDYFHLNSVDINYFIVPKNDGSDVSSSISTTPGFPCLDSEKEINPENRTLKCTISNTQKPTAIEVRVFGNPSIEYIGSVLPDITSVDGEIGYDILITQLP